MKYHMCTKHVCSLWICIVSGFQVIKLSFSEQDVWIYLFFSISRRKQSAGMAGEAVAGTPNIIMKNWKK